MKNTSLAPFKLSTTLSGLGLWNVYFIAKFILASLGTLVLQPIYNALLIVVLLMPPKGRELWEKVKTAGCLVFAVTLAYSESWLPSIDSLIANAQNVAGFSINYLVQLAWDFINVPIIVCGIILVLLYQVLKHFVRVSVLTIGYFVFCIVQPYWADMDVESRVAPMLASKALSAEKAVDMALTTKGAASVENETIQSWYTAFLEYEKDRKATLPNGLSEKDSPFDIVLLNICSLSNDDLEASGLEGHKVFDEFDIRFDHFNTATSYSGPATLRLLNGACGQPSHGDLYGARRPDCEIMNRLDQLGFRQYLFMDHSGEYDNYLSTLRKEAGLTAPHENKRPYPVRYIAFNDEPIYDSLSVLRHWQRTTAQNQSKRSVSLINLIALHDGNRLPRQSRWQAFKPRAKILLDDLNRFMRELDRTGRKVMLIVVPEHGAAVRGDKIQAPRLRDIPSLNITEVPVLVKFFGLKGLSKVQHSVTGESSYLALSSLIGKTVATNFFSQQAGAVSIEELTRDLPETNVVSENGQSIVLRYKGKDYIRMNNDVWRPYAH